MGLLLSSSSKFQRNKKAAIGLIVIAALAGCIMIVPDFVIGFHASLTLKLAAVVLLSVYVVLSFEIVHRTAISLIGALVIIVIGMSTGLFAPSESFQFATGSIDFNTLGLLLGMMIIVAVLAQTGLFQYIGIKMSKVSGGNLWRLLLMLCTFTAITSMFIDNVTTVLLMVPITISIFRILKVSPIPFILAQVLTSNVGGAATLIGDPPNIMIGSATGIDFSTFILHMGPTIALSFGASLILLRLLFRKELSHRPQNLKELMSQDEASVLGDRATMKKALTVLFGVVALFAVHGVIHVEPSIIALGGAAVLFIITKAHPEGVLHSVDWTTLIFFAGLFIIIGGAEKAGMIDLLSKTALDITGGNLWIIFFIIIWMSAIASAFVDNIPFAATMIPLISALGQSPDLAASFGGFAVNPLWWALALGVGLGGNGTLIGSSAGVVATGLLEKEGHAITFNRFFRVGFPFMLCTVAIGSIALMVDILLRA
jgi:Na+/H+ antiporter NhaD/arsenite permease-like protein